jgi:hypothetical protein
MACALLEEGTYFTAKKRFEELGDYKDSKAKAQESQKKLENKANFRDAHYGG